MNLKKNERLELLRQGASAVSLKISELEMTLRQGKLERTTKEKNRRAPRSTRRIIAQLKTGLGTMKETK